MSSQVTGSWVNVENMGQVEIQGMVSVERGSKRQGLDLVRDKWGKALESRNPTKTLPQSLSPPSSLHTPFPGLPLAKLMSPAARLGSHS